MSDSYERRSISAAGAQRVIAAGIAKAEEIGVPAQPGMAIFGGGVPLLQDGTAIGAVGASGESHDEDAAVAEAAAAALSN